MILKVIGSSNIFVKYHLSWQITIENNYQNLSLSTSYGGAPQKIPRAKLFSEYGFRIFVLQFNPASLQKAGRWGVKF